MKWKGCAGYAILAPVAFYVMAMVAGRYWTIVLLATVLLALAALVFLVSRLVGVRIRPRRMVTLVLAATLSLALIPFWLWFRPALAQVYFQTDVATLSEIGQALRMYQEDYDGGFPPEEGWQKAIALHLRNAWTEPVYYSGTFAYAPPKPGSLLDETVVISYPGWRKDYGVRLDLYASGRLDKRLLWPWWKYLWQGRYLYARP